MKKHNFQFLEISTTSIAKHPSNDSKIHFLLSSPFTVTQGKPSVSFILLGPDAVETYPLDHSKVRWAS